MTDATSSRRALTIPAETGHLAEVRAFVRDATTAFGAAAPVTADLVQAVDEAVCNVIVHGYGRQSGEVELSADLRDGRIEIRILDRGPRFDPTTATPADVSSDPRARQPGGMGIHLMRSGTDEVHHRPRDEGGNELVLIRKLDGTAEED